MMKITLIYPAISVYVKFGSFGSDNYASNWIHHGLCSLSASCKKQGFSDISLIDLRACKSWDDFKCKLKRQRPDVLGVTISSLDYQPAIRSIGIAKKIFPEIKVVVGGIHPTVATQDFINNKLVDYIVRGEGEISFPELLNDIRIGKKRERVIEGKRPDLDRLPLEDRELFDYRESIKHAFRELEVFQPPFVTMIAGRGCKYNCSFCQPSERTLFGHKVRMKSPERVIEELIILREKYGFNSLMLHDDCLTEEPVWVEKFCNLYRKNGFTQPFFAQSRADIICKNERLIKLMAGVGLKYLSIGFESGNQRVLNFLRKGTTVEQNFKAAEICKKYNIKVGGNFMLGIPTETRKEAKDTIDLIERINPYSAGIACYTPYPGSDLYDFCLKNNLLLTKRYNSYNRGIWYKKVKGVDYRYIKKLKNDYFGFSPFRRFLEEPVVLVFLSLNWVDRFRKFLFRRKVGKITKKYLVSYAQIVNKLFRYARRKTLFLIMNLRFAFKMKLNKPVNLLCIANWRLGDEIIALPVYEAIKSKFPKSRIFVKTNFPEIFVNNPFIDEVDGEGIQADKVFDLRGVNVTVNRYDYFEKKFNICIKNRIPKIYGKGESNQNRPGKDAKRLTIAFSTESGWKCKRWSEENYRELMKYLLGTYDVRIIQLGINSRFLGIGENLINKTSVKEAIGIVRDSGLYIGNDSALLNIALATGTTAIGLFGPVVPEINITPRGNSFFVKADVNCFGCWNNGLMKAPGVCPKGTIACMKAISFDKVKGITEKAITSNYN